jgi:hypothetical protein
MVVLPWVSLQTSTFVREDLGELLELTIDDFGQMRGEANISLIAQ